MAYVVESYGSLCSIVSLYSVMSQYLEGVMVLYAVISHYVERVRVLYAIISH